MDLTVTMDKPTPALTNALEDYLETIYQLVRVNKLARVKDIAGARGVRSASVTPAMKRLADLGLIRYEQREYIDLTPEGEVAARRILSRHQMLTRFFTQFLGVEAEQAESDACSMEHSLSSRSMSGLVRLFEFLDNCPEGARFQEQFHACPLVQEGLSKCPDDCACKDKTAAGQLDQQMLPLDALSPGEQGRVTQGGGQGAIRQRILDMGILPGVEVRFERTAPAGDPIWIRVGGFQLSLRRAEAVSIQVMVPTS
jgi:DtxR family transcriptional regulator, Mn-dependent transcriptional regulator